MAVFIRDDDSRIVALGDHGRSIYHLHCATSAKPSFPNLMETESLLDEDALVHRLSCSLLG